MIAESTTQGQECQRLGGSPSSWTPHLQHTGDMAPAAALDASRVRLDNGSARTGRRMPGSCADLPDHWLAGPAFPGAASASPRPQLREWAMAESMPGIIPSGVRFYDLSQPIFPSCPGWPAYPGTVLERSHTIAKDGFNAERLDLITHTGTHLDVPFHFFADGKRLEQVPVDSFQGPAVALDLRGLKPSQGIGAAELAPFAERIQPGDIVLLRTGWDEKRSLEPVYLYEWPYLTGEGARWLVDRRVRAVGIDGLSVGGWAPGTGRPAHEALLGAGVWILEEVRFPEEVIAAGRFHLFAFPILLEGCGGSLVRAVAMVG